MAELNIPQKRGKRKVHTPRIDLTPMVDLGFLLITFFMYTTVLAKPNTIDINMPSNEKTDEHLIPAESTITLIPVKGHMVVYYEGILENKGQLKECFVDNIRDVLLRKKKQVIALPANYSRAAHKLFVLIKPDDGCKYGDMVQLLDEMNITGVPNYTLMDISLEEKELIENFF